MFGLLMGEYAILVFIDWLLGKPGFGLPGYGLPGAPWTGTFVTLYIMEWVFWFIIPIVTMLWWRNWSKKHPELLEEL